VILEQRVHIWDVPDAVALWGGMGTFIETKPYGHGVFSVKRTKADYQAWRDQRNLTTRKYAMWERGERLPSQKSSDEIHQ
jgi:hypothetical protein